MGDVDRRVRACHPRRVLALLLVLAAAPRFGPYPAEPLAGDAVVVPDGLPGTLRVALVAFQRDRAEALDVSFGRVLPLEREIAGLYVVQTPVIGAVNGFVKGMILGTQRMFVPEARRGRYIPLFVDTKAALSALELQDPSVCVALVFRGSALVAVVPDACATSLPGRLRPVLTEVSAPKPAP